MMLTLLTLFAALVAPACVQAQSATIFPVALGPEANLQGEIIGSGGQVGTTFVLSGQTLGVEFTLTLAQDASRVAEKVVIPSRSYDLSVGCVISAGSAVCQNVVVSAGATSTLPLTTLPYSPFAVPVSTSGVSPSSTSASGSVSSSGTTLSNPVSSSTPVTVHSPASESASVSTPAVSSSAVISQITISAPSTAPNPGASTATLASPVTSQSITSDATRVRFFTMGVALIVPMVVTLANAV